MDSPVRAVTCADSASQDVTLESEWLVANGLGGYASGTVCGINTRRYHGLLIAALPDPHGRMVIFDGLVESLVFPDGRRVRLTAEERESCALQMHGACFIRDFQLRAGLPAWRFQVGSAALGKRVLLRHRQNTVQIVYQLLAADGPVTLELRPACHFRPHQDAVSRLATPYTLNVAPDHYAIAAGPDEPVLRLFLYGERARFVIESTRIEEAIYRQEEARGYPSRGDLWSPGFFQIELTPGQEVTLVGSTESPETIRVLPPADALACETERRELLLGATLSGEPEAKELTLAADQFIIMPAGRVQDTVRIRASGDEVRTVIAGYHWFTDWGRDTMISLEGLGLVTGRYTEAGWILRTFAYYIADGLIPNMFPESEAEGVYNAADATLWYFHAIDRYLTYTGDRATLRLLLPRLLEIVERHLQGTRFGIGVDPGDGLLRAGARGYALTWMDAKVGDWVVTPRRGKPVEINALWYNALRLLEGWVREERGEAEARFLAGHAERARESFNRRFWNPEGGYLYDVIDGENGDDPACRPNQVLAVSLPHPVLEPERWRPVLDIVTDRLLTPVGLRSLAPGHPDYKPQYFGDVRARDAAYHQGTVWAWLIGPYIDAWLKLHPDNPAGARRLLGGLVRHLNDACLGSISEVFDAEPPFTPRGCIAQAWSVAEVLRCWHKTRPA
ncbi:MAG: glycogen debranching enzyme family protein [Chloroflexi bacterium]|nr:glycogen debranching enzyme family protein [Chloroflexota bacterium]